MKFHKLPKCLHNIIMYAPKKNCSGKLPFHILSTYLYANCAQTINVNGPVGSFARSIISVLILIAVGNII